MSEDIAYKAASVVAKVSIYVGSVLMIYGLATWVFEDFTAEAALNFFKTVASSPFLLGTFIFGGGLTVAFVLMGIGVEIDKRKRLAEEASEG